MKSFILSCFIAVTLFCSCKRWLNPLEYHTAFQQMKWLEGTWQGKAGDSLFYETWTLSNDTLLCNQNYKISGSDKLISGRYQIEVVDGQIYYSNDPQPGEKKIRWELTDIDKKAMRFENPDAPYSQVIGFKLENDSTWKATLTTNKTDVEYVLHRIAD
jgi:hypothetical protein